MQLILFFTFFSFIILFTVLGYWKRDFAALMVSGLLAVVLGVFVLWQGIGFPAGYETNTTEVTSYSYGCFECNAQFNDTVMLNSTKTATEVSAQVVDTQKSGFVYAMGLVMLLMGIYLICLGADVSMNRK